jgi:exonuclease SbcC
MRVTQLTVTNFGSYENLTFDFNHLGLSLISGPTGVGKSTLLDAVTWCLFGRTAKGGGVDDVRNWAIKDQATAGIIKLNDLTVTRIRGKSSENDLYWQEGTSEDKRRGKDLKDTQRLLEARLGVTADLFSAATYYNEFSTTSSFFTDRAKDRRELFDKIANLDFPMKLLEGATNEKKKTQSDLNKREDRHVQLDGRAEELKRVLSNTKRRGDAWHKDYVAKVLELVTKSKTYETEKTIRINELIDKAAKFEETRQTNIIRREVDRDRRLRHFWTTKACSTCGTISAENEKEFASLCDDLNYVIELDRKSVNSYITELEVLKSQTNPYVDQVEAEETKVNPFAAQIEGFLSDLADLGMQLKDLTVEIDALQATVGALTQLQDLSSSLRSTLLSNAISTVTTQTNHYLTTYFDSEITVTMTPDESDNLDVNVYKNGYEASYFQLSKGQRGLLKLCFALAIMKAASNKIGLNFNLLMFDESLDGLSADLKVKAFNLFCELEKSHESILVIDHAEELKSLFSRRFNVTLENDRSIIEEC